MSDPLHSDDVGVILHAARQQRILCLRILASTVRARLGLPAIFLPLACGYLLSYVFRTVNGPLADELIRNFRFDASSLGLLTSVYFLAFAISAVPIGVALDAAGPRLVQGWLLLVAATGATVFALAQTGPWLMLGRGLIGLGVAGGLMAGLKAHTLWVAPRRLALANGSLVMFGGLGAIAATLPVSMIDRHLGWRGTFMVLAVLTAATAMSTFALVPERSATEQRIRFKDALNGFIVAVTDRRFLRVAPLSASVVGSAFAIQGLWAARWLTDIDGYRPNGVLRNLFAMGVGLTIGALLIGAATTWLCGAGVKEAKIFRGFSLAFIAAQVVVLSRVAVPAPLLWGVIGGFSGMSVLSYSILDSMFPSAIIGRANSALNVLHLATAWAVQAGMGLIIGHWAADPAGHYPLVAYRAAFGFPLALQIIGLVWFLWSFRAFAGDAGQSGHGEPEFPPAVRNEGFPQPVPSILALGELNHWHGDT
jgi:predicted MFS family arabinose efflux permease